MRRLGLSFIAMMFLCVSLAHAQDAAKSEDGIELRALLETSAMRLKKRFIIDPRVNGRVFLAGLDPNKLSYTELQSILSVHGVVATPERNGTIEIIPDANARQIPTAVLTDKSRKGGDEDIVTRTLDVTPLNAAQLIPILRPLLPQYAHMAAHVETNSLILVARQANVDAIEAIVRDLQKRPVVTSATKKEGDGG